MLSPARPPSVLLAIGLAAACSDDSVPPPPAPLTSAEGAVTSGQGTPQGGNDDAADPDDMTSTQTDDDGEDGVGPSETTTAMPPSPPATPSVPTRSSTLVEAEDLELAGQYAGTITMPFNGVALYANGDSVSFEHTFPELPGTYRIDVTGASSNQRVATAELQLGTRSLGDLAFRSATSSVQTLEFSILAATPATRTLRLLAINDDDTWDLFIDKIELTFIGPAE